MNGLVKAQLTQIEASLHDLDALLTHTRDLLEEKDASIERMTQNYWSRGKEIAVLKTTLDDYQTLEQENERLQETMGQFQEHLGRLMGYTKALVEEFRP